MFLTTSKLPPRLLAGIALASFGAVAIALMAQHGFGVKPCAWCVLQRGIFLLTGAVALLGWQLKRGPQKAALAILLALSLAGLAAAYFHHQVAAQLESCALTLADRLITAMDLEELWPFVFRVTASCSDAAAHHLLGLSYEIWSGLLFLAIAVSSLVGLKQR